LIIRHKAVGGNPFSVKERDFRFEAVGMGSPGE
jgi:hypothetical protein